MQWVNTFMDKINQLLERIRPAYTATSAFMVAAGKILYKLGQYIYRLRSLLLAAPVAAAALVLALNNMKKLPETVEMIKITYNPEAADALFGFLELGSTMISRSAAVYVPALVTAGCLVMMMCSKRALYPFLISVFTLCVPLVIWFFNVYPM